MCSYNLCLWKEIPVNKGIFGKVVSNKTIFCLCKMPKRKEYKTVINNIFVKNPYEKQLVNTCVQVIN